MKALQWHLVTNESFDRFYRFLVEQEPYSLNILASLPIKNNKRTLPPQYNLRCFFLTADNRIVGAASLTANGILYCHTLIPLASEDIQILRDATRDCPRGLFEIAATYPSSEIFKSSSRNPSSITDFYIMKKPLVQYSFTQIEPRAFQATEEDIANLVPVHHRYYEEEVYLYKNAPTYEMIEKNLRLLIKNFRVYFLNDEKGRILSKLNTTLTGEQYTQLGGVYTEHHARNQGNARKLLNWFLVNELPKINKNVSLFVKKENERAIKLYRRCGFEIIGEKTLIYFNQN